MKVLVMEDEFHVLKGSFDYMNEKFYNGDLEVKVCAKSQDFPRLSDAANYDKIFVDISLHRTSEQDGYAFIKSISRFLTSLKKVVVITGSDKAKEILDREGIFDVEVLNKPINFLDLHKVMPKLST